MRHAATFVYPKPIFWISQVSYTLLYTLRTPVQIKKNDTFNRYVLVPVCFTLKTAQGAVHLR